MRSKHKLYSIVLVSAAMILMLISIAGAAPFAYILNGFNVTVINTSNDTITDNVPVVTAGANAIPYTSVTMPIAVSPNGSTVYVTNEGSNTVSVINATNNTVVATIPAGPAPGGVAVTPDGSTLYVANQPTINYINNDYNNIAFTPGEVSVIDTATNTIITIISLGKQSPANPMITPCGIAVTPDGTKVYVTSTEALPSDPTNCTYGDLRGTVYVIDTVTNRHIIGVSVGEWPFGVAIGPDSLATNFTNITDNKNNPLFIQFNDTSTGSPTSWYWDFGDGNYSTDPNPTHEYAVPGTYSITETIRNSLLSSILNKQITASGWPSLHGFSFQNFPGDPFIENDFYNIYGRTVNKNDKNQENYNFFDNMFNFSSYNISEIHQLSQTVLVSLQQIYCYINII